MKSPGSYLLQRGEIVLDGRVLAQAIGDLAHGQRNLSLAPDAAAPKAGDRRQRAFVLGDRAKMKVDETARTLEVSFSSEEPVERYWGTEILDHEPKSVDFSRLKSAGPVLMDHDRRDQVGVVEKVWLDDKVGRALLRFSKSARGQEVWADVLDGIRRNVSVSYSIDKIVLQSEDKGAKTYRIQRWCPEEISIVSVPADTSVGVGRAGDTEPPQPPQPNPALIMNRAQMIAALRRAGVTFDDNAPDDQLRQLLEGAITSGNRAAAPPAVPAAGQRSADVQVVDEQRIATGAATRERERLNSMQSLWHQHNCAELDKDGAILRGLLDDPAKTVQDVQNWILAHRYKATPANLDPTIGMSKNEIKRYSVVRAIALIAQGKQLDGLEGEASAATAKAIKREAKGFFIPHDIARANFAESKELDGPTLMRLAISMGQQRGLTAGSAAGGGYTVGTDVLTGSLIELLRNKMMVQALGARNLSGLVGDVSIPRHTGGATAYWLDETTDVTLSTQTLGQLALTPHRLGAATSYTKQLLAQSSLDIEAFVRSDLMTVLAIEKDRAALNGLNAAGEPLGILNTTGIGSVTFGAAATWAKLLDFETQVANANADLGALAYLTTPATRAKWKAATKIASSQYSDFLWEKGGIVNDYPARATLQVPSNKVIFGNWNDLLIADWDGIDVVVDPYTLVKSGQIQIVIHILTDNGMRHVGSFCVSSDSGAQ